MGNLFLMVSAWFGYCAYDKMFNYYNPSASMSLAENAYVGGDAYNYIINSNYVTGMSVLCMGFLISALICFAVRSFAEAQKEAVDKQPITNNESTSE